MRGRRALLLLGLVVGAACADESLPAPVLVDVIVPAFRGAADAEPPVTIPSEALVSAEPRGPGRWALSIRPVGEVRVQTDRTCPAVMERSAAAVDPILALQPLYEIVGERDQIGFGESFELRVESECETMEGARYEWRSEGPELPELNADGATVRGRMPPLASALGMLPRGDGVIAISPRTRGTWTLKLAITLADGATRQDEVTLHAAARATGMPSVPIHVAFYVRGSDLASVQGPPNAEPPIFEEVAEGIRRFVARGTGRYSFVNESGELALSLFAGSHASTPLDCGRSECHAAATEHASASPMTTVFSRLVEDESYTPGCAMGCHTLGEPGTDDGGFVAIADALGEAAPGRGHAGAYDALPREIRRLSGVGCTACHGPGAIPEPSARTRILRTDVCATCHDAPPRYGHVVAFLGNRMSRAARTDGLDADPRCLSCHTTDGFLHGVRAEDGTPREVTVEGLGCATCHAPHAAGSGPALLRRRPLPALLSGVSSSLSEHPARICTTCHAPMEGFDLPTASATALVVGRGGFDASGDPLGAPAPHAEISGGCLACHGSSEADVERGGGHTFAVSPVVCESCHEGRDFRAERAALRARAIEVFERTGGGDSRGEARSGEPDTPLARARWNAALVRFDRGAYAHAGSGADALLDAAEALLAH